MKPTKDAAVQKLHEYITVLESVAVAYSGGTDSAYLLSVCLDLLGPSNVLALTADSPLIARTEVVEAEALAAQLGARHQILSIDDLAIPQIASNPPDRCYHCKFARFSSLLEVTRSAGISTLVHGENADDEADYRPGSRAAEELGVRAPLREAGLSKADVRRLSKTRGLSTWDKPANACLASRFPYGTALTRKGLARVESAETTLRRLWRVEQLRVRDTYPSARIEVSPGDIARVAHPEFRIAAVLALRQLGYRYVALDLDGYRMGSLNNVLEPAN
jgi:uncharacterized protein